MCTLVMNTGKKSNPTQAPGKKGLPPQCLCPSCPPLTLKPRFEGGGNLQPLEINERMKKLWWRLWVSCNPGWPETYPVDEVGLNLLIPLLSCKTIKILDSKEFKFPQESHTGKREESKPYFQKEKKKWLQGQDFTVYWTTF